MNLRTYRAYTMAEALAAVKRDLGPDAVILNTRTVRKGGFLGIGRSTIVEVTAVPAEEADARNKARPRPANAASAARAYGGAAAATMEVKPRHEEQIEKKKEVKQPVEPSLADDQQKTREFARTMLARLEAEQTDVQPVQRTPKPAPVPAPAAHVKPIEDLQQVHEAPPVSTQPVPELVRERPAQAVARRFVLQSPNTNGTLQKEVAADGIDQMQSELSAIRQMVGQVLQHKSNVAPSPTMPAQLFDYYLKLVAQDLSEDLADQIINDVRDELSGAELDDQECVHEALMHHLAAYIPCSNEPVPLESPDDRPLTFALVGPTGVGKTTTLAKLAATLKLQHDMSVALITSDTYRIAAVDQLRTYAGIIGLPLEVVLTPAEMGRAVARMQGYDAILIDTAGRSQRDTERIEELRQFIDAAQPHEVHLVLSSTASEKVLLQEAEAFARVGVDKLVFTKLDEAVSFGMLINVARQLGTQLSFLTTGQEVPDHLEAGQPHRLAELVLGGALNP